MAPVCLSSIAGAPGPYSGNSRALSGKLAGSPATARSNVRDVRAVYSGGPGVIGSSSAPQTIQVTGSDTGGGDGGTGSAGSLGGGAPMFGS